MCMHVCVGGIIAPPPLNAYRLAKGGGGGCWVGSKEGW